MASYYRYFRSLGLNATRAHIAAKLAEPVIGWIDEHLEQLAGGIRGWSDHMCRTFVRNGYTWKVKS